MATLWPQPLAEVKDARNPSFFGLILWMKKHARVVLEMKKMSTWYRKRCQPFFLYMCPLNQPSDMFINVLLQDVRHPKVRYTPKLNIESFFHGVWKRAAILVIATNICVTSMPYCWLYIPSDFSSIERINPYCWYWYIYIYLYIYIYIYIYIHTYMIYIYIYYT